LTIGGFNAASNVNQYMNNALMYNRSANNTVTNLRPINTDSASIPGILPLQIGNMSAALVLRSPDGDRVELSARVMNMQGRLESPDAVLEPEGACETCAERRYVDVSDDMSVSYQTPTNIHPSIAAIRVAAHEQEHVQNEQANAERNDRTITHQSVTFQYAICADCGTFYVAGGTTRTSSVANSEDETHEVGPSPDIGGGGHEHNHTHGDDEEGHSH